MNRLRPENDHDTDHPSLKRQMVARDIVSIPSTSRFSYCNVKIVTAVKFTYITKRFLVLQLF